MRCPVCRAAVDQGPTCRRCKADLSMLFAIEAGREAHLAAARRAVGAGRIDEALAGARAAAWLRRGADASALEAAALLLRGDFVAAWRAYQSAKHSDV